MAYPTMWLVIFSATAAAIQVEVGTSNKHMAKTTSSLATTWMVEFSYTTTETLPTGVTSSSLMASKPYVLVKKTGLADALNAANVGHAVSISDITITGCTVNAANVVRQYVADLVAADSKIQYSVTTTGTVQAAGRSEANALASAIKGTGTAAEISRRTNSAAFVADWSGEQLLSNISATGRKQGFVEGVVDGQGVVIEVMDSSTLVHASGEEYCENGFVSAEECERSTCCLWNPDGLGRCWSDIGSSTCYDRLNKTADSQHGVTSAPASSPILSPTIPTAAPPRNFVGAQGDPHMTSVTGAKFDILRSGNHTLLHIPQHSPQESALVFVRAFVKHEGATCLDMYIESLHITGKWAEEHQRGGLSFFANQSGGVSKGWLSLGKLDLKVVYGTTISGVRYLNMFARHLAQLSMPIGGILGLDAHESATTPEADCQRRISFVSFLGEGSSSSSLVEVSGRPASWATF